MASELGKPEDAVPTRRRPGRVFLAHALAISQLWAALVAAIRDSAYSLESWLGEGALKTSYDTVVDPDDPRAAPIPVIPDAFFVLRRADLHQRAYFLEMDLGTADLGRFRRKVRGYELYRGEPFRRRYGLDSFTVLVVTESPRRLRHLIETAEPAVSAANVVRYYFGQTELLRPERVLRPEWVTLGGRTASLA